MFCLKDGDMLCLNKIVCVCECCSYFHTTFCANKKFALYFTWLLLCLCQNSVILCCSSCVGEKHGKTLSPEWKEQSEVNSEQNTKRKRRKREKKRFFINFRIFLLFFSHFACFVENWARGEKLSIELELILKIKLRWFIVGN